MTGSLQVKGGKYYAVLNFKSDEGKRLQKWFFLDIPERNGKRKAEKAMQDLIMKYENTPNIIMADMDFADCVQQWLNSKVERIELDTWECYESYTRVHIIPYFKKHNIKLSDVKPAHIEDFYEFLHREGRKDGKGGLHIKTIKKIGVILKGVFDYGMKNQAVAVNMARAADLPLDTSPKFKGSFYSIEKLKVLLEAVKDTEIETPVMLAAAYGLRRSEICGLKWSAVDFDNDILRITDTVVKVKTQIDKPRTKTEASYRELPLLPYIKTYLMALKATQEEQQDEQGNCYTLNNYVCKWADGRLLTPDYVSSKFKKVLAKHGLPHIRLHDLRHSAATNLLGMGHNVKDVSRFIGHSTVQTTIDLYCHSSLEDKALLGTSYGNALFAETPVLEKC